ncbi:MAG: creatininase family protein [Acidobacteriota bacterium]|nr:creatininase family protein [Acidobacteriota bacterium]
MSLTTAWAQGKLLSDMTWLEAEKALKPDTIVVIPIGAESKEHGPHLLLKNDFILAEYLKKRVLAQSNLVMAPTVNYNFYPAFLEYPGSISLTLETARDLMVEIATSLARYGPKRFYVLNTGVSTKRPLEAAVEILAKQGIVLRYTDLSVVLGPIEKQFCTQEGGTHADESETSMLLYIDPASVNMAKAVKDYHPSPGPLTRDPKGKGTYSATGIYGDPTLATREKGQKITEALVRKILEEIESLRKL